MMLVLEAVATAGVRDGSFTVRRGETVVLLGPPGSGKTALLRSIAGLEAITAGRLVLDGEPIHDMPVGRRSCVYLAANDSLFRHLTVFDNIAYGLQLRETIPGEIRDRVEELLSRIGLTGHAYSLPSGLAAEARWRVALARAAAIEPKVLLLDEPPGDPALGIALARSLAARYDGAVLAATADRTTALSVADRIAFIREGRIEQVGTPADLYLRPISPHVADYVARANLIDCTIASVGSNIVLIEVFGRRVGVPIDRTDRFAIGDRVLLVARPETLRLAVDGDGWNATVRSSAFLGASIAYEVEIDGQRLSVLDTDARAGRAFPNGGDARVAIVQESLHLLPT